MKLVFSSILLASLCAPVSWSASATSKGLSLVQSPDVSIMEGETVNITCCWSAQVGTFKVNWMKDQNRTEVKYENVVVNKTKQDSERKKLTCSSLSFESIRREDSGHYICKLTVDIPKFSTYEGNGTIVAVTTKDNETTTTSETEEADPGPSNTHTAVIVLTVAAPLLLIAIVCYCKLRRKKASIARVIYEVPRHDSDLTDIDKHSTGSSTGSSHWCQVPVYESFDYFERVQTKPSG